jgi:hypothetical protein
MFQKTESLFLYLDLLSCPFLTNSQKLKIESDQNIISELEQYSHIINILGDSYRLKEKKEEGIVDSDLYKFQTKKSTKGVN